MALKTKKSKAPAIPSDREIKKMDEDELEDLVNELDIEFPKGKDFGDFDEIKEFVLKKVAKLRDSEGEKADLPSYDELMEMGEEEDEDSLTELAEKAELDPDDYGTWSELAEAIAEELEIEEEKKPSKKKKKAAEEEEEVTYESLTEMGEEDDEDGLTAIAKENKFKEDPDDYETWAEFAEALAEHMELEPEKKSKSKKGKKAAEEEEELPDWDAVHEMSEEELTEFASEHNEDLDKTFEDLSEAADYICEELEIEGKKKKSKLSKLKMKSKK